MHICLFDIDGTLISSGGAGKAALEATLAEEFGIVGVIENLPLGGRTDRAIMRDLMAMHVIEDTPENRRRLMEGYLRHLPEFLANMSSRVLPGIDALLGILGSAEGVAVGLLTGNLRAGARVKLGHFDLFDRFAFGGYGDHHFDRDDVAREALGEVHRLWNGSIRPDRIWVIGDTPLDVRCARAIGAQAVAVATGWHSTEELAVCGPDLLFADLGDPTALLERLVECGV